MSREGETAAAERGERLVRLAGGVASLLLAALLPLGAASMAAGWPNSGLLGRPAQAIPGAWPVIPSGPNSGISDAQFRLQCGVRTLDAVAMSPILIGYIGLRVALRRASAVVAAVAAVVPPARVVVLLATHLAGRSAAMGSGLLLSFLMLRGRAFPRATGRLSVLAKAQPLVGHIGTTEGATSAVAAARLGTGRALLTAWSAAFGQRLMSL